jgi:hypothetical protein
MLMAASLNCFGLSLLNFGPGPARSLNNPVKVVGFTSPKGLEATFYDPPRTPHAHLSRIVSLPFRAIGGVETSRALEKFILLFSLRPPSRKKGREIVSLNGSSPLQRAAAGCVVLIVIDCV